jgi:hypothetical protein
VARSRRRVGETARCGWRYDAARRKLLRGVRGPEESAAGNRARLRARRRARAARGPGSALASDQPYRDRDIAIDFCEDVPRLPRAAVDRIVAIMESEGLTAKISSIHVNGWIGRYDKLGMTRTFLREAFAIDLDAERDRYVFAGDSPNDAPMFAFFPERGRRRERARLPRPDPTPPAWITEAPAGEGFVELVDALLAP